MTNADNGSPTERRRGSSDLAALGEADLRQLLDSLAPTWTLIRLSPAARRKWKAQYRLMIGEIWLDADTASQAYAHGIQHCLAHQVDQQASSDVERK